MAEKERVPAADLNLLGKVQKKRSKAVFESIEMEPIACPVIAVDEMRKVKTSRQRERTHSSALFDLCMIQKRVG